MADKNITMKDVAAEAGVALGTVSKVVRGIPVGQEYKDKVDAAIEKLGYTVNRYAQGLKSGKTYNIAVLLPNTHNPFFGTLAYELNVALSRAGYKMLLYCTDYSNSLEQEYVNLANENKIDGIIGLTYNPDLKIPKDTPFVSIDRTPNSSVPIPCVASDNFTGGAIAAAKLYENGCRKLAFLRQGSTLDNEPSKRHAGFEAKCRELNVDYDCKLINDGAPFSEFEDYLNKHIKKGKLEFDGLFCVNDRLAWMIIDFLRTKNISVPEDVQIVGFDGIKKFGDLDYTCSTVVQPVKQIAETCVNIITNYQDDSPKGLICLPVTYAYGRTTNI